MPRKTYKRRGVRLGGLRFNEAAARCHGKPGAALMPPVRDAMLQ